MSDDRPACQVPDCPNRAIVYLSGRALCAEHYVENLNELNDLGLTPRGLSGPEERLVRAPVEGPTRERQSQ